MRCKILFSLFLLFIVSVNSSAAYADLLITPTRVVFNEGDRFAVVTLVNPGDKTQTYEMGWRFFRMQEEGDAYKPTDKSVTDFDVTKHVMFTPRRVTLAAGAKQKVRLRLSRPEGIPSGDYRGHFEFASVGGNVSDGKVLAKGAKSASVAINVGYTIPVILRIGKPDVKISIDRIQFDRNKINGRLEVSVPLLRSGGAFGGMGHLFLTHVTPDGKEEVVGEIGNANIYPEVLRRVYKVPLTKDIAGGKLRVVLYNYDTDNRYVLAQGEFPLN